MARIFPTRHKEEGPEFHREKKISKGLELLKSRVTDVQHRVIHTPSIKTKLAGSAKEMSNLIKTVSRKRFK
ncbi:MAG: hypothetical protein L0207_02645 [Chlamydiae bacterium]|nr:hypothetical protein [Chlamydiota bacterium]